MKTPSLITVVKTSAAMIAQYGGGSQLHGVMISYWGVLPRKLIAIATRNQKSTSSCASYAAIYNSKEQNSRVDLVYRLMKNLVNSNAMPLLRAHGRSKVDSIESSHVKVKKTD